MDSFSYKSAASRSFSCSEYPYIICFDEGIGTYGFILTRSYSGTWTIVGGYSAPKIVCNGQSGSISFSVANSGNASDITNGSFLGNQSSQSSTQYPNNGIQNSVWYEYKGSDTIDPYSVSYSKAELQAGEPLTISISPRSPTYGGTISYQYQYSTNGGSSWATINNSTTATSATVTIPESATQFQARVRAADNYGFTSSTYVAGSNLAVSQMKGYVGINGKARAVTKLYVGVNGKARQVVKGYIGVGGKARRFL